MGPYLVLLSPGKQPVLDIHKFLQRQAQRLAREAALVDAVLVLEVHHIPGMNATSPCPVTPSCRHRSMSGDTRDTVM